MKRIVSTLIVFGILMTGTIFGDNLIINPSFEDQAPAFWSPLNGTIGVELGWVQAPSPVYAGFYSFMVSKGAATSGPVGWVSDNNADLFWNNGSAGTYSLSAMVKTVGVNTSPANDDAKIGLSFEFLDVTGAELHTAYVWADQATADGDWASITGVAILAIEPTSIVVTAFMGKDATGMVYFDNIGCGTDPWSMGLFNGNAETIDGWLNWYASDNGSYGTVTSNRSHSGTYTAELFKPDTTSSTSEIVYYSVPTAVEPGEWYKVGVWVKTEDVNDSADFIPSFIMKDRIDARIGLCYFWHVGSLETEWSLEGGDKYAYIDQTTTSTGWTHYQVVEQAPANATGISVRARFTSNPTGTAYFDDFSVDKIELQSGQHIINPSFEDQAPAFWSPLNGTIGVDLGWVQAPSPVYAGFYSFMVSKGAATSGPVGWVSDNNADLFWNNASAGTYSLSAMVKTVGVNTSPANDDAKIGLSFEFLDVTDAVLHTAYVWADQATADGDWAEITGVAILATEPSTIVVKAFMGKDATGAVYFDNIGCGTDPWSMGLFNGNAETIDGWLNWYASDNGSYGTVTSASANSGTFAAELFKPDTTSSTSEIVYYSVPVAVKPGEWYKIGVYVKTQAVNDSAAFTPTFTMRDRIDERIGLCYFWHVGSLEKEWSLEGGDKYAYIDQTTAYTGWTHYQVVEQAPANATGISVRARFTSNPTGKAFFDDFSVYKMVLADPALGVDDAGEVTVLPTGFELKQNYPNPFNPTTTINFAIPQTDWVNITVYNLLGRKITTLVNGVHEQGSYKISWNGMDGNHQPVPSGVYIYSLRSNTVQMNKKMILLR